MSLRLTARSWSVPLLASFADQALFSGANFGLNLLLARWLPAASYGGFAVAFAAFLFLSGFHNALLIEPMNVLGARRRSEDLGAYLGGLVRLHGVLTLPVAAALAAVLALPALRGGDAASPLLGLAVALAPTLLFWLARSACYLSGRAWLAATGSGVYAAVLLGLLFLSRRAPGRLDAFAGFLLFAGASVAGLSSVWRRLGVQLRGSPRESWRALLAEHWPYARWVVPTAVVNGVSTLAYVPLLVATSGLEQGAAYRALQNLTLPLQQALTAATLLALPYLARQALGARPRFRRAARRMIVATCAASALYAAVLLAVGARLLRVLYPGQAYAELYWTIPYLAASLGLAGLGQAIATLSRAEGRPAAILWSKLAAAVTLLSLGVPAMASSGLRGALSVLVAATAVETGMLLGWRARTRPLPEPAPPAPPSGAPG